MNKPLKITVIADTHYYSRTLGSEGRAFTLRSESDQKCLAETAEIVDAAFKVIAESDTDAVMIAGDLSDNGERVCHEEFREKLYELQKKKPVYVITATHDWCCDGNPRRFCGDKVTHDVETVPPEELRDFYRDFGPRQAESEFFTHLGTSSYSVDLSEKVRILCLNDDQCGSGGAGFSEEHFKWIESRLADAREKGMQVISMQHHLLLDHIHPMISGGGMSVKNEKEVASRLADAGLRYSFVGHSHMTDVKTFVTEKGNRLSEVNVGSLCGYPAPMARVTVNENSITVDMEYLKSFAGAPDAQKYLKEHTLYLINKTVAGVAYGDKKEYSDRLSALNLDGEKLLKYRFALKPAAKWMDNLTVGKAYRILNPLTLGKVIDIKTAEPFWHKKVLDIGREVFLNIFAPGTNDHPRESNYYKLVTSVISIPSKVAKGSKALRQVNELVSVLVEGNELNKFPVELK